MQKALYKPLGWLLLGVAACWLGWLLFVVNLDAESIWYDEWITWEYSRQGPAAFINPEVTIHPPVYYLWVWAWMGWTQSDDVLVMRLSSVIPAVIAVALCYRVGTDWFGNRWAGLAAAVFLATSGIFVYYARELRMYSLVVMFGLGSWWLLWRYLTRHSASLIGYGALVALMAYTYYFTAFMAVMQAAAALLIAPRRALRLSWAYGGVFLAFLPWLPVFYMQLVLESERAGRGSALTLSNIGKFAATKPTTGESIHEFIMTYTAGQPAFVILLLALAFAYSRARRRAFIMAALWLLGTITLFFGINLITPVYNLRYPLMVIPALALLVGMAVNCLPSRFALVAVLAGLGIVTHSSAFLEPKPPHRELMQTLSENYQPGDRIWYNLNNGALGSSLQYDSAYYLEHSAANLSHDTFVWDASRDFADVEAVPRVWDVRPYWITMPEKIHAVLLDGRVQSDEYIFGAYSVRLYEAPPRDQPPVTFGDQLALIVSPLTRSIYRSSETVSVKTWWRALEAIPLDYSYGLYLRNEGGTVLAQVDAGLETGSKPTSQWSPASDFDLSRLELLLPANLPAGTYGLWLTIYYWEDPRPLPVSAPETVPVDANVVRIADITLTGE